MSRGAVAFRFCLVGLTAVMACASDAEPPSQHQGYVERHDGAQDHRVRRLWIGDEAAPRATVERTNISDYVARNSARGQLSPAADAGPSVLSLSEHRERTKQFVAQHALNKPMNEKVRVVLDLGDFPFPERAYFRDLTADQRALIIEERKEQLRLVQRDFVRYLEGIGAVVHENVGAFNHVRAEIPAGAMEEVLAREEVEEVQPSWERAIPLYDLEEGRQATFIDEFWSQGIEGDFGGRTYGSYDGSGLRLKVAVIEVGLVGLFPVGAVTNGVDEQHPGWADGAGLPTRIKSNRDCSGISGLAACPSQTTASGAHGTWVTSVLLGDITEGQDPNITDPLERLRRTGMAPEAALYYLNASYPDEIAAAIFNAVGSGADVINLSLASPCQPNCSPTADCGGMNSMIRFATESGVLVVAAAGNSNGICISSEPTVCSVCQPALRPEVLAVGNVDTLGSIDYDVADIHLLSSRGKIRVGVAGQYASLYPNGVDIPAVSISAPGTFSHFFFGAQHEYLDWGGQYQSGTSLASPVIAGGAALLRQEMGYLSPFHRDVNMLRAKIIAMGDGTGAIAGGYMSEVYGAGKVKFHPFNSMVAPKGQSHQQFRLYENEVVTLDAAHAPGSLPPEATQWKMGMDIKVTDYSSIPYVILSFQDVCGGTRWLATDWRAGLERHMILDSQSFDADTCIRVSVSGYSIPPGGVTVSVYDYYHSGDPSEH